MHLSNILIQLVLLSNNGREYCKIIFKLNLYKEQFIQIFSVTISLINYTLLQVYVCHTCLSVCLSHNKLY